MPGHTYTPFSTVRAEVQAFGLLAQVGVDPVGVGAIVDALAEVGIDGNDRVGRSRSALRGNTPRSISSDQTARKSSARYG